MKRTSCSVCYATDIVLFLEVHQVPVHCNLLWETRNDAVQAPRGEIQLGCCSNCGHIQNLAFQPELMEYSQGYENSLSFSPRYQKYTMALAMDLVKRYSLRGKQIVEIGSGRGDFLKLLCELGGNQGVGFDPTYVPDPDICTTSRQVTFVQDFYSKKYRDYEADFICSRHVLEHLREPREILKTVNQSIEKRENAAVFFEVPNVMFTLRDLGIWDVIYEHPSYFSACSFSSLFLASGFMVSNLYTTYRDQFLCVEAYLDEGVDPPSYESRMNILELTRVVKAFADKYHREVEHWRQDLRTESEQGKKIIIWGGGSKGVTFLNVLNLEDKIHYVVDINPYKHGKFIGGTGQKIVPPRFLQEYKPDVVVVMNSIYLDEIEASVVELGLSPEILPAC